MTAHEQPTFVADAMLAGLTRWLRTLGYDVLLDEALPDHELARLTHAQGRRLLTRDRRLCEDRGRPPWCLLLEARKPAAQLLELHTRFGIFDAGWRSHLLSRCTVCNTPLRAARDDELDTLLPPDVRDDPATRRAGVTRCPDCGRIYWRGGHVRRMEEWLERVAARAQDVSSPGKE